MRLSYLMRVLTLAAAMVLPCVWSASAAAESGAHRQPPPPPVDQPITVADLG